MSKTCLDLHGFKAEDVIDAVDKFLVQVNKSQLKQARIMTGKGTGTVRKIVIEYLKLGNYPWDYEKLPNGGKNEGVIVIFLD
jgi:dsDNA-specific endonuclease/ATPase MutS2